QVRAAGALRHHTALLVELRRAIRAGPLAVTAADALVLVDQHETVGALVDGRGRADFHAGRLVARHARHRHEVREEVVRHVGVAVLDPLAARVFRHTTPHDAQRTAILTLP